MASPHYFDFIGTVWNSLPAEDRDRMAELWQGYEQVVAAVYQKYVEVNLNIAVQDLTPYSTERWLPYEFSSSNFISRPATVTSNQDISNGLSLATRYLLRFRIDGFSTYEVDVRGANPLATNILEIVSKINDAVGFNFARAIFDGTVVQLVSRTSGLNSSIEILATSLPMANACEFVLGVDIDFLPQTFPEFRYTYRLPYTRVASIPSFQDAIRDESMSMTLIEGVDYVIGSDMLTVSFREPPPPKLWARRSLMDNENPWNNFGFLMGIYQKNSPRYVDVIQGLWFAFWNGPTPQNVRRALYLLFGLPVAQASGVVTAVSTSSITIQNDDGSVQTVEIASGLEAEVTVGQRVNRFDPLVSGIDVFDKINRPGFIAEEIGRAGLDRFLTEDASRGPGDTDETKALTMLEEYTFLPQISVNAFINQDIDLGNVKIFLDAIKPLNKAYLFQVIVGTFSDELVLEETASWSPNIDLTPSLDSNETTYQSADILTAYETAANEGLNLDPEGVCLNESVEIEVRSFGSLIDSFTA